MYKQMISNSSKNKVTLVIVLSGTEKRPMASKIKSISQGSAYELMYAGPSKSHKMFLYITHTCACVYDFVLAHWPSG